MWWKLGLLGGLGYLKVLSHDINKSIFFVLFIMCMQSYGVEIRGSGGRELGKGIYI